MGEQFLVCKTMLNIRGIAQLTQYLEDVSALKKELDADREAKESKVIGKTFSNKTLK